MAKRGRQLEQGPLYLRLTGTRRYYRQGEGVLKTYSRESVEKFKRNMDPGARLVYDARVRQSQKVTRARTSADVTAYMNKYPNRFKNRTEVRRDSDFKVLSHLMRRVEAERSQHKWKKKTAFYEPDPVQDSFYDLDGPYAQALIALGYRDPNSLIPPGKSPRRIPGVSDINDVDEAEREAVYERDPEMGQYLYELTREEQADYYARTGDRYVFEETDTRYNEDYDFEDDY